jgi:hypothetical protein
LVTFVFVLVDWLADEGVNLVDEFFTRSFVTTELVHLRQPRYARYMLEHEVKTVDDLEKIVDLLVTFGFAARVSPDAFQFRRPAYRILDICREVATKAEERTPEGA